MKSKRQTLWNDDQFRTWVEEGAKRQGMTVSQVLKEAGVSRFYLKSFPQPTEGRSTNIVMLIARIIGSSPAELFGLPDAAALVELQSAARLWQQARNHAAHNFLMGRHDVTMRAAQALAAQLIALYLAPEHAGEDPVALTSAALRQTARYLQHEAQVFAERSEAQRVESADGD